MGWRKKCSQKESSPGILLRTRSISDLLNQQKTLCFWWHQHIFTTICFIRGNCFIQEYAIACMFSVLFIPFLSPVFQVYFQRCLKTVLQHLSTRKSQKKRTTGSQFLFHSRFQSHREPLIIHFFNAHRKQCNHPHYSICLII